MLNLTPEKRRHHLRMRRLDKGRKKASWKEEWKADFGSVKRDRCEYVSKRTNICFVALEARA